MKKMSVFVFLLVICLLFGACSYRYSGTTQRPQYTQTYTPPANSNNSKPSNQATNQPAGANNNTRPSETKPTTPSTEQIVPENIDLSESYEHNDYYDIVESATLESAIGGTIIIHKVLAKQDVSVDSTVIAYDENGNVVGKETSNITLTSGEYNYFYYKFYDNIGNATLKFKVKLGSELLVGPRHCAQMTAYNVSGSYLYITFEQLTDTIGAFARYKVLFYKNDKIVWAESSSLDALNVQLDGKGSTDVAEVWLIHTKDFDRIECFIDP